MKRALLPFIVALLVPACSPSGVTAPENEPTEAPAPKAGRVEEDKHDELPRRVRLSPAVITAAKIQTSRVIKEQLAPTLALPGEIASDPDRTSRVSVPAAGRLVSVSFREGAKVQKGDLLGVVRVADVATVRAAFSGAAAKAASARANADRLGSLADKGLAARQEAVTAKSEAEALAAEARGLAERLGAIGLGTAGGGSDIALRAPAAGIVLSRDAVVGQPVSTDQTIGTIADLSEVWFLARVFEKDLDRLAVGSTAEIELNAYPAERFTGVVEYVGRQLDPVARTVTARVRIAASGERVRVGLFGNARVAVTGAKAGADPVVVVPRTAIVDLAGKSNVFVRHPDGDFERHDVVIGGSSPRKVEILSGLREGEDVVTEGAFSLKSVVLKSSLAEED